MDMFLVVHRSIDIPIDDDADATIISSCHRAVFNGWWEWLAATIERVIAVKNRSHNPKTTNTKLQRFFFD